MAIGVVSYVSFDTTGLDMDSGVSMNTLSDRVISESVAHTEALSEARAREMGVLDVYTLETVLVLKGRMRD